MTIISTNLSNIKLFDSILIYNKSSYCDCMKIECYMWKKKHPFNLVKYGIYLFANIVKYEN